MESAFPYQITFVLALLLQPLAAHAQLQSGGDVAGGYWWNNSHRFDPRLKHAEGKGNLWLGRKAGNRDWRLSLTGNYKNVDGEMTVDDVSYADNDTTSYSSTNTSTNSKPLNLSARYDYNWRSSDKSTYSLWGTYDYTKTSYENSSVGYTFLQASSDTFGRFEAKKDRGHKGSVGYSGTTLLNAPGWVLRSKADVSLLRRTVDDTWLRYQISAVNKDVAIADAKLWEMYPDYTDYTFHAALELTDSVYSRPAARLVLGGGVRFNGEGERFLHDFDIIGMYDTAIKPDSIFIDQRATGFRYFVEPFVSGDWLKDKWSLKAEYGLRLYHMSTTEETGHAVILYNYMDKDHPLSGNSFSHFTPLATGNAKVAYTLSKHHSLSLSNTLSNRLPTNQQAVLGFVQSEEFNKVSLGNPNLKPEVKMQLSLDHTFTSGPFSAQTGVTLGRQNNQMEYYYYGCMLEGRNQIARVMLNVADVTTYKLFETLAWKNRWLKASATLWWQRAHHQGTGGVFGECVVNDNSWGWSLVAGADLGCGWRVATDFQYMSANRNVVTEYSRSWPSSTVSVEKRIPLPKLPKHQDRGSLTFYLTATSLFDPDFQITKYDTGGRQIYSNIIRANNRIATLGCRWTL